MFNTWRRDYWLPIETNREFALHFRKPNACLDSDVKRNGVKQTGF